MFLIPDKALVPNTVAEATDKAWIVLIQDVLDPVDVHSILTALSPEIPVGAPIFIRPDTSSWEEAGEYQRQLIADIFAKCRHSVPPRFAVFSIAPIPLIVHLGFLLAYNVPVRYYKLHIDTQSWKWPEVALQAVDENIQVNGVPQETILERSEVLIRISLSAFVGQHETDEVAPGLAAQIDIFVDKPNRTWIRSPKQLDRLSEVFRGVLDEIRQKVPYCQRIHLFCAIPAPAALAIGRQINPRMDPPVSLYEVF
ncbi:MAG: SAVED domain-containing protein [Chloroflexi bacterium]|nr:SAVED domain-containing protein [Chloroflexota bacterium]